MNVKLLGRYVKLHREMEKVLDKLISPGLREMIQEIIDEYFSKMDSPFKITKNWYLMYYIATIRLYVSALVDSKTGKIIDEKRFSRNYPKATRNDFEAHLKKLQELINGRLNTNLPPNLIWITLFPKEKKD